MTSVLQDDGSVDLYPNFLSDCEAQAAFEVLWAGAAWSCEQIRMFGRTVSCPRLTAWYGEPGLRYCYSGLVHVAPGWIEPLSAVARGMVDRVGFSPNSVLCNLYRNGHDYMGWHSDREKELGRNPIIASLSLGAERRLQFRHIHSKRRVDVCLPHGSLLMMKGSTQHHWQHRLPPQKSCSGARINLTFRHI